MSEPLALITVEETLAVADRVAANPRHQSTLVPQNAIASLAILCLQLDRLALAAAAVCTSRGDPAAPPSDGEARERRLREHLHASGYLPSPTHPDPEAHDGSGAF